MDSSNVLQLLDQLDDDVDDLEESLGPLLKTALAESASKLPLLDKAKLYVLVTFAIESVVFAYLRLNGVKAREHPVFKELTRVKQYFDKLKAAEAPVAERTMAVDKVAAARFIKAGLAGNDKHDLERAERQARERAKAPIKFEQLNTEAKKRKAEEPEAPAKEASSPSLTSDSSSHEDEKPAAPPKKKQKVGSTPGLESSSGDSTPKAPAAKTDAQEDVGEKKKKKKKSKAKKANVEEETSESPKPKKKKKKSSRKKKTGLSKDES